MELDTEKVELLEIGKINPIFKLNFNQNDIENISNSISEIGYQPIIVRHKSDDRYQLCSNPETFEAMKVLGKKKIDVIIRNITEQQGKEITLASLLTHPEISSKDRELLVWTARNSGNYKSNVEFGRKIGKSDRWISDNCYAKEKRKEIFGPEGHSDHISTDTLRRIKTLTLPEQKKFCARIKDGKILPSEARNAVNFINSHSEEIKNAILNGEIPFKEVKDVIEKRQPILKNLGKKIENKYKQPKVIQRIIKKEIPYFTSEIFQLLKNYIKEMEPVYYDKITDETEKKQADIDETIGYILHTRYMFKRNKIDFNLYESILKCFKLDSKTVENLKEDGHNYNLPREWLTPEDIKLQEKLRKVDTGRNEPLEVLT